MNTSINIPEDGEILKIPPYIAHSLEFEQKTTFTEAGDKPHGKDSQLINERTVDVDVI